MEIEVGQLRRFHDDAFHNTERHLNGKLFTVISTPPGWHVTILVDGTIDEDWGHRILEDNSEVVDGTR